MDREITSIEYKDKQYPVIDLYIWKYKSWRKISVESLSNAISPDGSFGDDVDEDGWLIDQSLFFYIPDDMLYSKRIDIMRYINMNI